MGCRVIQTNWKTSSNWALTDSEKNRAKVFHQRIMDSGYFEDIFKESSFDQLIKQSEIDVLGINTNESIVFGVDVAFHGAGLNYGSKEETAHRILKKIFRTIFVMQTYFDQYTHFQSLFITPKTNPATLIIINDLLDKAIKLIDNETISIGFITNDDFFSDILDPTINASINENDTSELFLRAVKLLKLDSRKEKSVKPVLLKTSKPYSSGKLFSDKRTINGMKIGQYVQYTFREAFEQGLISKNEIQKLQKDTYSKEKFGSNFEVLRLKSRTILDDEGRPRYYVKELFCENYYLTSQWVESQWDIYVRWLKTIGYNSL